MPASIQHTHRYHLNPASLPSLLVSLAMLLGCLIVPESGRAALPANQWYPRFPQPAHLYRTGNVNALGGVQGANFYMLHSLAGLAAKSVREGTGDTMIWIDYLGHNEYSPSLLTNLLSSTSIVDHGAMATWDLVNMFKQRGLVNGYILYNFEAGTRGIYADGTIDESVNVATSMASLLNAIIIQPSQVATAQSYGLTQLLDARALTEQWVWDNYGSQFNLTAVVVQDPKLPELREMAIALKCFCMFGVDALATTVYSAMPPNTPVLGWNQGDEYLQTRLATDWGHWNDANNLSPNLPVMSSLVPGDDFPVAESDLNARSRVDLTRLVWEEDVHYTSMILSDGDSFNLNIYYLNDPERMYYQHRARGEFPFGWGTSSASLYQTAPSVLRLLGQQATANDSHVLVGGGYYYPDRWGSSRANAPLADHLDDIGLFLNAMRQNMFWVIYSPNQWNSANAAASRTTVAQRLPFLDGVFGIDYSDYAGAQGALFWNNNGSGTEIPTLMARYAIWNNSSLPTNGTPLEIAAMINARPHTGPATSSSYFDWTVVHAWSFFQNGQDISQSGVSANIANGIERAYGSARWCAQQLAPHVRLVKPDELLWYLRLHLKTQQTFRLFLTQAQADLTSSTHSATTKQQLQSRLNEMNSAEATLNYTSNTAKRDYFEELQSLRRLILSSPNTDQSVTGFEPAQGFSPGALPQQAWFQTGTGSSIITSDVHSGVQSLATATADEVRGWFEIALNDVFWVDGYMKAASYPLFDGTLSSRLQGPVLRLSSDRGLVALNGNGIGGGVWVNAATLPSPGTWQRISLRVDQANHKWNLYLNANLIYENLGFKDQDNLPLSGFRFAGDSIVDDLYVGNTIPSGLAPNTAVALDHWAAY